MRRKSLEPNSYYIALTLGAQADLARDRRQHVEAERLYRQAMAQWEASGRDEAASSTITQGYAEMLRGLGRNGEAAALEAKVPLMADSPQLSAGLLLFRRPHGGLEVFLAHPGGPFWRGRDLGALDHPQGTGRAR